MSVNRRTGKHNVVYTDNEVSFSLEKERHPVTCHGTMNLEDITPSEISPSQKTGYHMIPLTYVLSRSQTQRDRKMRGSFQGLGKREGKGRLLFNGYGFRFVSWKQSGDLFHTNVNIVTLLNSPLKNG